MLRRLGVVLAAIAAFGTGCSGSLFESDLPAATRYVISAPAAAETATVSGASEIDLAIGRPDVAPGLDTERIAVLRGHELDYYRGALWGGTVTETVQTFMVTALQDQRRFRSVAAEQARIAGDYLLDIEVRDFQAEYAGTASSPTVRVTLVGRLIRIVDREMVDTISATATRAAGENRMSAVAAAFQTAMQQVALELSGKTAQLVASDAQRSEPTSASR